jgi:hypothetical protein
VRGNHDDYGPRRQEARPGRDSYTAGRDIINNINHFNGGAQSPSRPPAGAGNRRSNPAVTLTAQEGPLSISAFMASCITAFLAVVGLVGCTVGIFDYIGAPPTLEACLLVGLVGGCGSCLGFSVIMLWGRRTHGTIRIVVADFAVSALIVTAFCLGGGARIGVLALTGTDGVLALGVLCYIARIRRDIRDARQRRHSVFGFFACKATVQLAEDRLASIRAIGSRANSADAEILGGCAIGAALGTGLGAAISMYADNGLGAGVCVGIGSIAGASAWFAAVLYPWGKSVSRGRQ